MHQIIPYSNTAQFLTGVVPSSNAVSNADELSRFAESLAAEANSTVCASCAPATVRAATRECRRPWLDLATGLALWRFGIGPTLGLKRFGPSPRDAPAAFGDTGSVEHRGLARTRTLALGWAASAAENRAGTVRPKLVIPFAGTGSRPRYPVFEDVMR